MMIIRYNKQMSLKLLRTCKLSFPILKYVRPVKIVIQSWKKKRTLVKTYKYFKKIIISFLHTPKRLNRLYRISEATNNIFLQKQAKLRPVSDLIQFINCLFIV